MMLGISHRSSLALLVVSFALGSNTLGCKVSQLTSSGTEIILLADEPAGCENLGVVLGRGGGLAGGYAKPGVNLESAENDARNQAAERGATHLLLHPEEIDQGDAHSPDYQDTQPAMAHGSGTGSTVTMAGTAYKCSLDAPPPQNTMSVARGSAFVELQAPTTISMAPLGPLSSITVFQRVPLPSGAGMGENQVSKVEGTEQIAEVVNSLLRVVEDPMKFIPTHRVEFVGELGVQSLLYGFGYLQYASGVYRLTDGAFETVLELREAPKGPDVETEAAPAPTPTVD